MVVGLSVRIRLDVGMLTFFCSNVFGSGKKEIMASNDKNGNSTRSPHLGVTLQFFMFSSVAM